MDGDVKRWTPCHEYRVAPLAQQFYLHILQHRSDAALKSLEGEMNDGHHVMSGGLQHQHISYTYYTTKVVQ